MIKKAYKYRIYPNKKQAELLDKHFGCNRLVESSSLEEAMKQEYSKTKKG